MAKNQWDGGEEVPLPAEWTGGYDVPLNEVIDNPNAAGIPLTPEIPAEVVPQSWLASLFPRTAQAQGAGATTAGAGLDVLSLPGRAYASLARPEGESYQEAIARTAPPAVMDQRDDRLGSEFSDRMAEMILRDPANIPLAGVTALTGGAAAPAWLTRLGWAGRAARAGVPVGATMAATRQAENVAAGRPMSAKEAGTDVAIGTGFGVASELAPTIGRGLMEGSKRGLQQIFKPGTAKGGQEIKEFRRAMDAGLLPEAAGWGSMTAAGAGQRFGERLAARAEAYPEILAAADATGQRVNVGRAMSQARNDVADQMARGRLPASVDEAQDALGWVADRAAIPDDPIALQAMLTGEAPASALTVAPSVAHARKSALWKEAFKDPTKSTARGAATKASAGAMASELSTISPELAALNAEMAPWYAAAPALYRAAAARGNAYGVGPMELLGAGAGAGVFGSMDGVGGGLGGGLGAALAVRYARSPAAMRMLYDVGRAGVAAAPAARRAVPLAASAVDNARGGR